MTTKKTDDGADEVVEEEVVVVERVSKLDTNFYREDLNALAAKLNEVIEVVNSL